MQTMIRTLMFMLITSSIGTAAAEWHDYQNKTLGFSVKLPFKPVVKQQLLDTSKENKLSGVKHLEISSDDDDTHILITVSQFKADMPTGSKLLGFAYAELKRSLKSHGKVEYDRNISGKGYVGHELRVTTKEQHYLYARLMAAGPNLIVVNIDAKVSDNFDKMTREIFNSMNWR